MPGTFEVRLVRRHDDRHQGGHDVLSHIDRLGHQGFRCLIGRLALSVGDDGRRPDADS